MKNEKILIPTTNDLKKVLKIKMTEAILIIKKSDGHTKC